MMDPIQGVFPRNPGQAAVLLDLALDVRRDFGASGSAQTTTGSIAAGSNVLTLDSPIDFEDGHGVSVVNAGPLPTIAAPTSATATPAGTTGTTTITYAVAALDGNGGVTASFSFSTTTANATLNPTNYVALSVTAVSGAVAYAWWRTSTNGTSPTTTGYIGLTTGTTLNDTGLAILSPPPEIPASAPSTALGGTMESHIVGGAGTTTLTLADTASTTVTGATVLHDDSTAIQAAINALGASGGTIIFPTGTYRVRSLTIPVGINGLRLQGLSPAFGLVSNVPGPATLSGLVPATLLALSSHSSSTQTRGIEIRDMAFEGNGIAITAVDLSQPPLGSSGMKLNLRVHSDFIGTAVILDGNNDCIVSGFIEQNTASFPFQQAISLANNQSGAVNIVDLIVYDPSPGPRQIVIAAEVAYFRGSVVDTITLSANTEQLSLIDTYLGTNTASTNPCIDVAGYVLAYLSIHDCVLGSAGPACIDSSVAGGAINSGRIVGTRFVVPSTNPTVAIVGTTRLSIYQKIILENCGFASTITIPPGLHVRQSGSSTTPEDFADYDSTVTSPISLPQSTVSNSKVSVLSLPASALPSSPGIVSSTSRSTWTSQLLGSLNGMNYGGRTKLTPTPYSGVASQQVTIESKDTSSSSTDAYQETHNFYVGYIPSTKVNVVFYLTRGD